MTDVDVQALANLARLEVSEEELQKLKKEILDILSFVQTIKKADTSEVEQKDDLRNVMRNDESSHESGMYTEQLLGAAPVREGDRIAVKQVISRQKATFESRASGRGEDKRQ